MSLIYSLGWSMCARIRRYVRPGRLLVGFMLLCAIIGTISFMMNIQENNKESKESMYEARKAQGHRWKTKTDIPKPIVDIIPQIEKQEKTKSSFSQVEARMGTRQEEMEAACKRHQLDTRGSDRLHRPDPWEYFINREHNLVWCNVFKSASTSWMYVFNVLAGYPQDFLKKTKLIPLTLARDRYPRPSVEELEKALALKNVTSLIIARHPFERLVSSYKDKIAGALPGTVHDKLRRKITMKYRPDSALPKDSRGLPQLPRTRKLPAEFVPTFAEFVQYVVDEDSSKSEPDMHWAPVYSFCNPCQVKVNTITKLETLEEDAEYILKKINVAKDQISMSKKNSASDGKKASEVTNTYLRTLGNSLYEQLLNIYEIDFNVFGYKALSFTDL